MMTNENIIEALERANKLYHNRQYKLAGNTIGALLGALTHDRKLASNGDLADVRSSHIEDIRKELQEFFANNMVSYWRIEEFELQENHLHTGINIIPKEPYFDESYSDDEADKRIEAIGKKYGMKLGWIYWVYPK